MSTREGGRDGRKTAQQRGRCLQYKDPRRSGQSNSGLCEIEVQPRLMGLAFGPRGVATATSHRIQPGRGWCLAVPSELARVQIPAPPDQEIRALRLLDNAFDDVRLSCDGLLHLRDGVVACLVGFEAFTASVVLRIIWRLVLQPQAGATERPCDAIRLWRCRG
ncbi:uncharacterized protein BJX67DRAFT_227543 [Aspergillus lucknowensis]|uniref:Uncharacterized protein n=1 Tax=Aspergillus lucknowensis TaxID=176173 RepID=A0ABR4LI21_9EURO